MEDIGIEKKILEILSPFDEISSNELFRKLRCNKVRYTIIRNKMIDEGWIHIQDKDGRKYLKRQNFEAPKFSDYDWTKIARINCNTFLKYLKERKPLFKVGKNKKVRINKNQKKVLDAFFHELDRQMIVHTRLVNAEALGLILPTKARFHQKTCVEFVHEFIKALLADHKEFNDEIKEYAQSQLRTVQFKI